MSRNNRKYLFTLGFLAISLACFCILAVFLFAPRLLSTPSPLLLTPTLPLGNIIPTFEPSSTTTSMPPPTETIPAGEPSSTPITETETPEPTSTSTFLPGSLTLVPPPNTVTAGGPTWTPNPATETLTLDGGGPVPTKTLTPTQANVSNWFDIQPQLSKSIEANISYTVPNAMKLGDTVKIYLVLNPSASEVAIVTQVVEVSGYATSTAVAGTLVSKQGNPIEIYSDRIQILDEVSADLSSDSDGFTIKPIHTDPIQLISKENPTVWIWHVTAKKKGQQKLTLAISVVVRDKNDNEKPRLLKTYENAIDVQVTPADIVSSIDWKWIIGIVLTALLIPLFFRWYDGRKKSQLS